MNVWVVTGIDKVKKFSTVSTVNEYEVIDKIELLDDDGDVIESFKDTEYAGWMSDAQARM